MKTAQSLVLLIKNKKQKPISGNLNDEVSIRTLSKDYQQKKIKTFKAHSGIIRVIKFINDTQIATGGEDNKVKIWDLEGRLISEFEQQSIEILDTNTIITASYDGRIKTWRINK